MGLSSWGFEPVPPGRLRVSAALALYRRRLRRRRWIQDLLAVLGIAAGVALLYATQVASTSLSGPVKRLNAGIVGAGQLQVLARGGTTIPEDTYNKVVALPGVKRAAPILQVPGNLIGQQGQADVTFNGADPRIVRLRGSLLRGFSSGDAARQETVIVPALVAQRIGLLFGDDASLEVDGRRLVVPSAVAGERQLGELVKTSVVLVPLHYLQRLAGVGHNVSRILVEAEPGKIGQVRRELSALHVGGADVRASSYETELFDHATKPTTEASAVFSALSALVGWLFAICALLVTASDRGKLVTQQRRQGFPPSATVTTLMVEATTIGVLGVAAGLTVGELVSRHGFRSDVGFLSGAFAMGDVRIVSWQSITIAVVGGILAAIVGVLGPVRGLVAEAVAPRRTTRAPTGTRGTRRPIPTWALGLAALVAAIVITVVAPSAVVVGLVLLAGAVAGLLPLALGFAIDGLRRLNRRSSHSSAALELALHQLGAKRWRPRALAIATTGAIAVFGAMSLQGARANLQGGLDQLSQQLNAPADVWVTAAGAGSSIGTTSFAPRDLRRIETAPGVAGVAQQPAALLDVADERAWLVGAAAGAPPQVTSTQVLDGNAARANAQVASGGWAFVSKGLADRLGVGIGDRFTLPSPHPVALRVAALTTNLGWSSGAIVIGAGDFRRAWPGPATVAAYQVQAAPGHSPDEVRGSVAAALGKRSGLLVETAAQRSARQSEVAEKGLARLSEIATLTLLAAVLAMSAAMIGMLWQHRPIVGGQKFLGLTTGLVWRALLIESATLFGVGVLFGALFGLLGQVLCTQGVAAVTGFPVVHGLRFDVAGIAVGTVLAASTLAVVLPGYLVARSLPSARE
ncbi:ABC transporter permease [Conexibacter woesei]|uniref:ABC transporter permease n=1 Tax=Conexibacter woesei TaxID=191495 RepID=UPI00042A5984|nr:ABC transporter permease [Conexibacter woesei]